jgi:hypothetical protein
MQRTSWGLWAGRGAGTAAGGEADQRVGALIWSIISQLLTAVGEGGGEKTRYLAVRKGPAAA